MAKHCIFYLVLFGLGPLFALPAHAEPAPDEQATIHSYGTATEQNVRLRKAHYELSVRKARIRKSLIILGKLTEQKPPQKLNAEQTSDWRGQNRLLLQVRSDLRLFHDKELLGIRRLEPSKNKNKQAELDLPKYQQLDQKFLTLYEAARRKIEDYHGLTQFTQQRNDAALTAITQIKG